MRAKEALGTVDAVAGHEDLDGETADTTRSRTIVSFTFDDGDATQYQVKDLLASRGMRGHVLREQPEGSGPSGFYMTWAQVDALAADGNEIAGHTLTHADLTDPGLTDAQKRAEVCDDRQNLVARGYDPVSFAYPDRLRPTRSHSRSCATAGTALGRRRRRDRVAELVPDLSDRRARSRCRPRTRWWCARRRSAAARSR